jgi:hypothetical protein
MGTEERCGRGEPHKAQEAGRRAQPKASMGLRSTRATARQREVSDGGTSNVSEPESLRKTCLLCVGATGCAPPWRQYTRTAPRIPWLLAQPHFHGWLSAGCKKPGFSLSGKESLTGAKQAAEKLVKGISEGCLVSIVHRLRRPAIDETVPHPSDAFVFVRWVGVRRTP